MRLIDVSSLLLVESTGEDKPAYAILSHTWDHGSEEVLFEDIQGGSNWTHKKGAKKILGACTQASTDGHRFLWVDTCCINKSSSAELSEAINSMFSWYSKSAICYVFLADAVLPSNGGTVDISRCRYFTRGWTLQELIAPDRVHFHDSEWHVLGDRVSMLDELGQTTQLPKRILTRQLHQVVNFQPESEWHRPSDGRTDPRRGEMEYKFDIRKVLDLYSISTRMSWARHRYTTRPEDMAYSLMGLFDVTMPVLYGEGAERAFYRLQVEIVKRSDDQSILAWRALPEFDDLPPLRSLFARSPGEFSSNVQAKNQHNRTRMTFVGGDLSIELLLCPCTFISEQNLHYSKGILGILDCVTDDFLTRPAIFLKEDPKGKRGTEFRRDIEESMWFIGPNGRELMQREEYEINAFKVEFNVKDARSARIIIHELSDYSYDTYGIFPPLRTHPIVQPSHRHFQHNITLAHSLDSMGEFIIPRRSAYHDFFPMLGFLSVIERQGEAECKPTPGFLLLWGQQTVLKYGRFETIEPWCKVLQKDGNMSREDLVRAAMEYYRAKVNGGFGFELPSSDSTVVLHETTNLTVHAGIRLVEFLDWAIYDLQITINEDGGGSGSSLHGQ